MYIYENHLGGLYTSEELIEDEYLYCEECGDWDTLLGEAHSYEEAWVFLQPYTDHHGNGGYDPGYIKKFLAENFEIPKNQFMTNREALKYLSDDELASLLVNEIPAWQYTTSYGEDFNELEPALEAQKKWLQEDCYKPLKEAYVWHDHGAEEDDELDKPNGKLEVE